MEKIREKAKYIVLLCLMAGALCACQGRQSANAGGIPVPAEATGTPVPTPEVAVTTPPEGTGMPFVTEEPLPTPAQEPAGELIPIDEAHFTCVVFREFIAKRYDADLDGFLSVSEREAVTEMELRGYYYESLDGFEYFPNLRWINAEHLRAEQLVLRNHPSLQFFGCQDGWESIGTIQIENCPVLTTVQGFVGLIDLIQIANCPAVESIYFHESRIGTFQIENCPALTHVGIASTRIESLSVSGTPTAFLDGYESGVVSMTIDADVTLEGCVYGSEADCFTLDGQQLCYHGAKVEWTNLSGQRVPFHIFPEIEQRLEEEKALQMRQPVAILDGSFRSAADGKEKSAIIVMKKASGENSLVNVRFYSEAEQPELENFRVSFDGAVVVDEYSPNHAITQHGMGWLTLLYEENGAQQEVARWKVETEPLVLFADGSRAERASWKIQEVFEP